MKKLFVTFVILLIVGAVAFGFGYVPIRIEPGTRALMFSRTSGWDSQSVTTGEVRLALAASYPEKRNTLPFSARITLAHRIQQHSASIGRPLPHVP